MLLIRSECSSLQYQSPDRLWILMDLDEVWCIHQDFHGCSSIIIEFSWVLVLDGYGWAWIDMGLGTLPAKSHHFWCLWFDSTVLLFNEWQRSWWSFSTHVGPNYSDFVQKGTCFSIVIEIYIQTLPWTISMARFVMCNHLFHVFVCECSALLKNNIELWGK